ncbi:hypothetical protein BS78_05G010800 [Paspalum vaginatum]|nr:hypothetical protein BS78_05G010800 [Paspalum vaginatum]
MGRAIPPRNPLMEWEGIGAAGAAVSSSRILSTRIPFLRSPLLFPLSANPPIPIPPLPHSLDAGRRLPMRPTTSSAATPPGSPAAAGPSRPNSAAKRQRKAAAARPLGDVTNLLLLPLPETPAPTKPRRTARRPTPASASASAASSNCSSTASVTPAPKPSSAAVLEAQEERSAFGSPAISTVYARRGAPGAGSARRNPAASKGKAPADAAGPASCPPLGKSTRKSTMAHATRPVSSSAPCHEAKKKKKRSWSSTPKLPEDFVKKQRAYFAEVDAFELPVEEVSESDLE